MVKLQHTFVSFTPMFRGKMKQFDQSIFFNWVGSTTNQLWRFRLNTCCCGVKILQKLAFIWMESILSVIFKFDEKEKVASQRAGQVRCVVFLLETGATKRGQFMVSSHSETTTTRCWFQGVLFSPRSLGKRSNLTSIFFQMGWFNHQLDM